MQLFTTQINQLDEQIKALELQLIEAKGKAGWLKRQGQEANVLVQNLKALIDEIKDENAIATLKSAVSGLFDASEQDSGESAENPSGIDSEASELQPEFGTPERPCPATTDGKCLNPECEGETFTCEGCGKETPYCFGGSEDELCNDCWSKNPPPDPETDDLTKEKIQHLKELQENQSQAETVTVIDESDEPEEKADPKFQKMFDGEPEPDDFDVVFYSDRAYRDENEFGVHFKLKREAKAWAEQFEVKYHDCKIEIHKDDFESFGYVLKMTKGNPNDPQWWQEVTSYDYSKSPEENRKPAVQRCDPADSQSAKERAPREQKLPKIEPLPSDVVDEEIETPGFSFMATGMGWLNVVHDGNVLGIIYSNPSGWELETGEQFETREEAAQALFNSTPSAA